MSGARPDRFRNRQEAGELLAAELVRRGITGHVLVLALPRGGVPVGHEVARVLKASLDTLVARKIGAPGNREYGVGALAPGDVLILDEAALRSLGISQEALDPIIAEEMEEMARRMARYASGTYSENLPADTVIIVDDGVATGVTAMAAIESVKLLRKPRRLIFAAPICARDTARKLREWAEVICLREADNMRAVGEWYEEFEPVSDEEVLQYLS